MEKLTSILVIVDPHNEMYRTLNKALVLARKFGAKLELFLCDSERAYVLKHSYVTQEIERSWNKAREQRAPYGEAVLAALHTDDLEQARQACLADGLRYLESLRESLRASDVEISVDVACHSPLYESIVHKVRETSPDLVIKTASGKHPMRRLSLDDNDWELARACPSALMLTRERQWSDNPRFGAAVDVSDSNTCSLARMIVHTADFLAIGCHAELSMIYSEPKDDGTPTHATRRATLYQLAYEHHVDVKSIHVLQGDAEHTLPAFAATQDFDVFVLGALTRKHGLAALVGTLTSKLVDSLDCDFVLVKPEMATSEQWGEVPVAAASGG